MATLVWLTYLSLNFVLIPLLFRIRFRRCPIVVPIFPRNRYDVVEHGYAALIVWFTLSLILGPSPTAGGFLGVCLVLIGSAIIAAAVYTLGPNWRIGQDATDASYVHVASRMYRFVSHPIYVGMTLVALGQTILMSYDWRAIVLLSGTTLYGVIQGRAELRRRRAGATPSSSGSAVAITMCCQGSGRQL